MEHLRSICSTLLLVLSFLGTRFSYRIVSGFPPFDRKFDNPLVLLKSDMIPLGSDCRFS